MIDKTIKFIKQLTPLEWLVILVAITSIIFNLSVLYWLVTVFL